MSEGPPPISDPWRLRGEALSVEALRSLLANHCNYTTFIIFLSPFIATYLLVDSIITFQYNKKNRYTFIHSCRQRSTVFDKTHTRRFQGSDVFFWGRKKGKNREPNQGHRTHACSSAIRDRGVKLDPAPDVYVVGLMPSSSSSCPLLSISSLPRRGHRIFILRSRAAEEGGVLVQRRDSVGLRTL